MQRITMGFTGCALLAAVVVDTEWGFGGAATLQRKTKQLLSGAR